MAAPEERAERAASTNTAIFKLSFSCSGSSKSGHCSNRFCTLDAITGFCTGLCVARTLVLLCSFTALFFCDLPRIRQITFVGCKSAYMFELLRLRWYMSAHGQQRWLRTNQDEHSISWHGAW